jgi:hypothetical protein
MAKHKISAKAFVKLCETSNMNVGEIQKRIKRKYPGYCARPSRILKRIENYRRKGLLPLDSGNYVSTGEILTGTTTLYDEDGSIKHQYVKTSVPKENLLYAMEEAIASMVTEYVTPADPVGGPTTPLNEELATVYISNDLHLGLRNAGNEVEKDWNLDSAVQTTYKAYDYLMDCSPKASVGIVVDLGDLTENNDGSNMTPKSKHVLDVDGRFHQVLKAAYETLIYGIKSALERHETVYFYSIPGNHDPSVNLSINAIIEAYFKDEPRVIVDSEPRSIKYHQHGKTLLQFAHGDMMKMQHTGEVMAHDCLDIFSETLHRYSHLGHIHSMKAMDTRLCSAESHRNLPPLNAWAYSMGFRGPLGTMKSITYSSQDGELSRQTFNVNMK